MNFLNPLFLFGLLAVVIPIIIHLVNLRRPKKVAFSTLSFFNELRKSTIRRIRIKQYLLLALRTLALLLLALALARPFLPPTIAGSESSTESRSIAILVDNSGSMSRVGSNGPLIEQAKNVATQIIENASANGQFLIRTTNTAEVTDAGLMNRGRAVNQIEDITVVNRGHYTAEQFRQLYNQLLDAPEKQSVLYIISDGQKSQLSALENLSIEGGSQSKSVSVQLITLEEAEQRNVAVSSLSLESQLIGPGSPLTLSVEVKNTGSGPVVNQYISLQVEEELSGQYETSLKPGETKTFSFEIIPDEVGYISGKILLEGDEVEFDNSRHFVVHIPPQRSILLVNKSEEASTFKSYITPALEAARESNARIKFDETTVDGVEQGQWADYDGIILNGLNSIPSYWHQELRQYVQGGGGILFFPSEKGDVENYNRFFNLLNAGRFDNVIGEYGSFETVTTMASLEEGHPVLDDIFSKREDEDIRIELPSLFYYYHEQVASTNEALTVLKAANDDALLTEYRFGDGIFLKSAVGTDPGWSNLPVNPLFAPMYYRAVLYTSSPERGGLQQHQLGEPFEWKKGFTGTDVTLTINGTEYKPNVQRESQGVSIAYEGREWEPGILHVTSPEEKNEIAVNQHIMESDFETLDNDQWNDMMDDQLMVADILTAGNISNEQLQEQLRTAVFGKEIWNWFVWIALLFLITETLVSRLYKAESIS